MGQLLASVDMYVDGYTGTGTVTVGYGWVPCNAYFSVY